MEHEITVELKNEVQIRGTLKSVDQYLNIKLDNAEAVDEMRWPHLVRKSNLYWAQGKTRVWGTQAGQLRGIVLAGDCAQAGEEGVRRVKSVLGRWFTGESRI